MSPRVGEPVGRSRDQNALGDLSGACIIWGANATDLFYVKGFFNESKAVGMLPAGLLFPPAAPALETHGRSWVARDAS